MNLLFLSVAQLQLRPCLEDAFELARDTAENPATNPTSRARSGKKRRKPMQRMSL